jgi:hypothetical protein
LLLEIGTSLELEFLFRSFQESVLKEAGIDFHFERERQRGLRSTKNGYYPCRGSGDGFQ